MKKRPIFLALSITLASSGCGSNSPAGGGAVICNGTTLKADEAHNYTVTSSITLPPRLVPILRRDDHSRGFSIVEFEQSAEPFSASDRAAADHVL